MRAQALFSLSTDAHGLPFSLHVVERRSRLFWPGEEARLLLLCVVLLAVVIWGCIRL